MLFLEMLIALAIFLAKAVIIVIAIIIVASFFANLALKGKLSEKSFKLTNLSKKLKKSVSQLKEEINKDMVSEKEAKKLSKAERKDEKKRLKANKSEKEKKLFILDFNGDIKASAGESLRKCVTQVISLADPEKDEVLIRLESPGGMVSAYGIAASELSRIRNASLNLTVSVDKVAASGGYLMSCVGSKIIAAPFAVVGSIGVVAGMPNFNKVLKKHDIDYDVLTAGKYKRTLTMFGENTAEGREKFIGQLEQIHDLFKKFVTQYRPSLDMDKVGTGEYWFGEDALNLGLVDEIKTSEDYMLQLNKTHEIFHLEHQKKQTLVEKFTQSASALIHKSPFDFI